MGPIWDGSERPGIFPVFSRSSVLLILKLTSVTDTTFELLPFITAQDTGSYRKEHMVIPLPCPSKLHGANIHCFPHQVPMFL
jgi:hypothetical protein